MSRSYFNSILVLVVGIGLFSCGAKEDFPGLEFSPNMYHSVPYEPLTQITDESEGLINSNRADGKGEFFNTNTNNQFAMNMRTPVDGTVPRTNGGFLPYRLPEDSIDYAAKYVTNPLDSGDEQVLTDGEFLYTRFCKHCHGSNGQGSIDEDALVGQVLKGVPSYSAGRVSKVTEGHIFHVITHGKGRMGSHASQLSIEERWKIVRYVQTLQNLN